MHKCFMGYEPEKEEGETFYALALPELTIYGHTIDQHTKRDYPEDWSHTVAGRKRGYEFACWHSVMCPDGEIGSNGVDGLRKITKEEFLRAWDEGWPFLPPAVASALSAVYAVEDDGTIRKVWDSLKGDV